MAAMQLHHGSNLTFPEFVAWVNFSSVDAPISYAFQVEHRTWLFAHIFLMSLASLLLLPAALLLRSSGFRPIIWIACCGSTLVGLFSAVVHSKLTTDLYENALHRKFGIVLIAAICIQAVYVCFKTIRDRIGDSSVLECRAQFIPLTQVNAQEDVGSSDVHDIDNRQHSQEDDSARSSETMYRQGNGSVDRRDSFDDLALPGLEVQAKCTRTGLNRPANIRRMLDSIWSTLLLFGVYVQILLGIATYCALFTYHEIFNGLAHWIKASIFLLYGIWVFIRYLGGSASMGHAWNDVMGQHLTPEAIESGLIFTYGISNLFLERLGHSDEPISHTDIQHMSIAAMFAFAGFIGLLIESQVVQDLLVPKDGRNSGDEEQVKHMTYNVLPALVVFFTGMLMSQHNQDTQFASDVHAAWGYYFCIASAFRIVTYILVFSSPWSSRPRRPPTEALVSFCLISGALLFMLSSRDPVQALEYYGIDLMFAVSLCVAGALAILVWVLYTQILAGLNSHGEFKRSGRIV